MKQAVYVSLIGVLFVFSAIVVSCTDNTINSSNEESGKFKKDSNLDGGNFTEDIIPPGGGTGTGGHGPGKPIFYLVKNVTMTSVDQYNRSTVNSKVDFNTPGGLGYGHLVQTPTNNSKLTHTLTIYSFNCSSYYYLKSASWMIINGEIISFSLLEDKSATVVFTTRNFTNPNGDISTFPLIRCEAIFNVDYKLTYNGYLHIVGPSIGNDNPVNEL